MSCEDLDYHIMKPDEISRHQRLHSQRANEADASGDGTRFAIESFKALAMMYVGFLDPRSIPLGYEGSVPLDPERSIAEIQLQIQGLETKGGQNG